MACIWHIRLLLSSPISGSNALQSFDSTTYDAGHQFVFIASNINASFPYQNLSGSEPTVKYYWNVRSCPHQVCESITPTFYKHMEPPLQQQGAIGIMPCSQHFGLVLKLWYDTLFNRLQFIIPGRSVKVLCILYFLSEIFVKQQHKHPVRNKYLMYKPSDHLNTPI